MKRLKKQPACISCLALLAVAILSLASTLPAQAGRIQAQPEQVLPQTPAGTIRFGSLSEENGLSNNQVQAILQDQNGFLWFGTQNGLNKYNGYEFTLYRHDENDPASIASNNIVVLYEDRQGILWIGTDIGLERFDPETGIFSHYQHNAEKEKGFKGDRVLSIQEDWEGNLWIGTNNGGLNRFDKRTHLFVNYRHQISDPDSLSSDYARVVLEDQSGQLWIGTNQGLDLFDQENERFIHFQNNPDMPNSMGAGAVSALAEDSQGHLWIGTSDSEIIRYDPRLKTFTQYQYNTKEDFSSANDVVWDLDFDQNGELWIGASSGLYRMQPATGEVERLNHLPNDLNNLGDRAITCIYEDQAGILWLSGGLEGVNKFKPASSFSLFQHEPDNTNSLSSNPVYALFQDNQQALWIGTYGGGLNRLDPKTGNFSVHRHDPNNGNSLHGDEISAIQQDRAGYLWVGTIFNGLDRMDPHSGEFIHYTHDPDAPGSLSEGQITTLLVDQRNRIWIGTFDNGLNLLDRATGKFTHYWFSPSDYFGISDNHITALYQDQEGMIWVGTWKGVSVLNPQTGLFKQYHSNPLNEDSLSNEVVLSFYEDALGQMWIGTNGGGLNRYDREKNSFQAYTETHGLPDNTIYGILGGPDGELWLSTRRGVSSFDPLTGTVRNYDVQDGLQGNEFNPGAYFQSKSGEMFFGGSKGFNSFYPRQVRSNPHIPPIVITNFSTLDRSVQRDITSDTSFELSSRDYFIAFEFAALDYSVPEKNEYAYKLEGVDKDWVYTRPTRRLEPHSNIQEDADIERGWYYTGARRYVSYRDLKEGEYIFRVKGANNDGVWNNEGIAITIKVPPPFWKTPLFMASAVLFVAVVAAAGYVIRTRSIEHQNRVLEDQIEERTSEIEQRRQVAEGLRDILAIINSNQPLDEILHHIVVQASNLLASDACVLSRFNIVQETVHIKSHHKLPEELTTVTDFPLYHGKANQALLNRQPYSETNLSESLQPGMQTALGLAPEWHLWQTIMRSQYNAFMAVPIIVRNEVFGCFTFYYQQADMLTGDQQDKTELAVVFADQAALAIENAFLRSQAEQTAIIAERNRLARDLHDAVTQTLFSASLIAEVLPRIWDKDINEGEKRLEELRQLTRGALAEMRTLLLELRPATLVESELEELLKQLSEAFAGRTRIPARLKINGHCELPSNVKIALFRIAQEALNNAGKHSGASEVTIVLDCGENWVKLNVTDNGVGFDPVQIKPDRLGLGIMKERAESIDAKFSIQSQTGSGTQVLVKWARSGSK
ncbi:MAG: GAF domain-containing protein [Anaerolineaceae bacterium]|nr:GAF domain-containing protein [Anaerolineaceae bacterium]